MDEAQRLYHEFEDAITIGAVASGLYGESQNLFDFSSRVFAVFAVASLKRVAVLDSEEEIQAEALKIRPAEYREAFIFGCRSRRTYRKHLLELNSRILKGALEAAAKPETGEALRQGNSDAGSAQLTTTELALTVIGSPWFGGFARLRKEDVHDPSIDFSQIQKFWTELSVLPDIKAQVIATIHRECTALIHSNMRSLPLIYFRRVLLYELCYYWEDQLALEELSYVYGAMRIKSAAPAKKEPIPRVIDQDDQWLVASNESTHEKAESAEQKTEGKTWDCINWYTSLPLRIFRDLVARCNITATVLLLECASTSEDPSDFRTTLPKFGYSVRSCMIHMSKLCVSNAYRRMNFEEEILDPKFWIDKRVVEDLDPDTLEPLHKTMQEKDEDESIDEKLVSGDRPPYYLVDSAFYVDCNVMNLELDFLSYFVSGQSLFGLMLCSGGLDPAMKSRLIALDSRQQQMERGRIISLGPIFFMPYLTLTIRRDRILDDALNKLVLAQVWENGETLKSPLKIKFDGEDGVDEGGVTKEFFQLLIEQILNPDYGMFVELTEEGLYYFMPDAYGTLLQFELIGIVLGLAVYNHVILDIHFPHFIYKKLLSALTGVANLPQAPQGPLALPARNVEINSRLLSGLNVPEAEKFDTTDMSYVNASRMTTYQIVQSMAANLPPYKPSIEDLQEIYPQTARGLRQLLMTNDPETIDAMCLTFSISVERFGEHNDIPLKMPNGIDEYPADKQVTFENRTEYIKAVLNHHLVFSINKEFSAFYKGFHRCCGGPALTQLTPSDLHLLICGAPGDLDFASLRAGARYVDGYVEDSDAITWFWEVAEALSQDDKKKLLFFITGSDRTPVGGLESLKLTISKAGGDLNRLPTAHTCFNHFLLPPYESKEVLEKFLRRAIEYRHGFGLR